MGTHMGGALPKSPKAMRQAPPGKTRTLSELTEEELQRLNRFSASSTRRASRSKSRRSASWPALQSGSVPGLENSSRPVFTPKGNELPFEFLNWGDTAEADWI